MNRLKLVFLIISIQLAFFLFLAFPVSAQTCTDSDGGKNYMVKGTATGIYGSCTDSCITQPSGGVWIQECYCEPGQGYSASVATACPSGYTCSDGACIQQTCTDSDGGKNYYVKGTVTDTAHMNPPTRTDYCLKDSPNDNALNYINGSPEKYLIEMYCDSGFGSSDIYQCPYGCSNGVCLQGQQSCPASIDISFSKNVYYIGDNMTISLAVYDINGKPIPNYNVLTEMESSTGEKNNSTQSTGPDGLYTSSSTITEPPSSITLPFYLTSRVYTTTPGCPVKSDSATITIYRQNQTCTDSDGGMNYYVQGTMIDQDGTKKTDYCMDSNQVGEYYCSEGTGAWTSYYCHYGCMNGACIQQQTCDVTGSLIVGQQSHYYLNGTDYQIGIAGMTTDAVSFKVNGEVTGYLSVGQSYYFSDGSSITATIVENYGAGGSNKAGFCFKTGKQHVCPGKIKLSFNKPEFHLGDALEIKVEIFDQQSLPMPNYEFTVSGYKDGVSVGAHVYQTDSSGVYRTSQASIDKSSIGKYYFEVYAAKPEGCDGVSDYGSFTVLPAGGSGTCAGSIDISSPQTTYYSGDNLSIEIVVRDEYGNPIPNYAFKVGGYVTNGSVTQYIPPSNFTTDSSGYYRTGESKGYFQYDAKVYYEVTTVNPACPGEASDSLTLYFKAESQPQSCPSEISLRMDKEVMYVGQPLKTVVKVYGVDKPTDFRVEFYNNGQYKSSSSYTTDQKGYFEETSYPDRDYVGKNTVRAYISQSGQCPEVSDTQNLEILETSPQPGTAMKIKIQKGWNLIAVPGEFVMGKGTCETGSGWAFYWWLPKERRFISFQEAGQGNYNWQDFRKMAFWAYSPQSCEIEYKASSNAKYYLVNDLLDMSPGWNMVPFTKDMLSKSITDIKGDCTIKAAYIYDNGQWRSILGEEIPDTTEVLGYGMIINVESQCRLGFQTSGPPGFPEISGAMII